MPDDNAPGTAVNRSNSEVDVSFAARHGLNEKQAEIVARVVFQAGDGQINAEQVGRDCGVTGQYVRKLLGDSRVQGALIEMAGPDVMMNLGPLLRNAVRRALAGSHQHWHDLMRISGMLEGEGPKIGIQVNNDDGGLREKIAELEAKFREREGA